MTALERLLALMGRRETVVSDEGTQPTDRDQLIARAQELGVTQPWFKTNDDLVTEIQTKEHELASKPTTTTTIDPTADPYADIGERAAARPEAPAEGADHPDPYAHLGGSVDPRTYTETAEEGDDES